MPYPFRSSCDDAYAVCLSGASVSLVCVLRVKNSWVSALPVSSLQDLSGMLLPMSLVLGTIGGPPVCQINDSCPSCDKPWSAMPHPFPACTVLSC